MNRTTPPAEQDWIDHLDGRLEGPRRLAFEAWLAEHPEDARELEDLRSLDADLVLIPLPELSEAELDQARARVLAALPGRAPAAVVAPAPSLLVRLSRLAWLPAAAAALVIGVVLGRGPLQAPGEPLSSALIDGRNDELRTVDGAPVTDGGSPLQRQLDIQDLDVDRNQSVRIRLKETNSYEINGRTTDLEVQNTLSYIVRNDRDPKRRQTAIQLLETHCQGEDVCQVLVYAMTQDPVADVRREAALALKDDQQNTMVRQSYIKMLVEDPSPALRQLAQGILAQGGGPEVVGR
ncbi:MAG: HEAT repeat domain-containing protein [Candidatus Delongbacteria bacterium]